MEKLQYYPNYVNHYEYDGGTTIKYTRTNGSAIVHTDFLYFTTEEEATRYFDEEC